MWTLPLFKFITITLPKGNTMTTTRIEMYRCSQYDNWEEAERLGGVYSIPIHTVNDPHTGQGLHIIQDIIYAMDAAAMACDANEELIFRVRSPQE